MPQQKNTLNLQFHSLCKRYKYSKALCGAPNIETISAYPVIFKTNWPVQARAYFEIKT